MRKACNLSKDHLMADSEDNFQQSISCFLQTICNGFICPIGLRKHTLNSTLKKNESCVSHAHLIVECRKNKQIYHKCMFCQAHFFCWSLKTDAFPRP